jgi:hypothetical protein
MNQPDRTRLALSLGVAGVLGLILLVAVLRPQQGDEVPATPIDPPEVPAEVVVAPEPLPPPTLRRGDLIAAAAQASAAYAAGQPYADTNKALVGRRFEVTIPFGCGGPSSAPTSDPARWNFDLAQRTVTLSAQPQAWTNAPWVREIVGDGDFEAIDGFWIPRPWLASEACPAPRTPPPGSPAPAVSQPSLGLVRTFAEGGSRVGQRGARPYEVVRRAEDEELTTSAREFRLVLSGRVSGFPSGEALRCHSPSIDQRPTCLAGVEIDRVAFVEPNSGDVLAEWNS